MFDGAVAAREEEGFDVAFVGFAHFVDFFARGGVGAGDGADERLEGEEGEKVGGEVGGRGPEGL